MEITRENFSAKFEHIRSAIERCTFLSIDCEFSGLTTGGNTCLYDTLDERYRHLKRTSSQFIIIQFGLATFTYDADNARYIQESFNFFLFPRQSSRGCPERTFLCQPSSLEFLSENGFNFNKLIKQGISYLRPSEEERLRAQMERQLQEEETRSATASSPAEVPEIHREFVDNTIAQVRDFLRSGEESLDLPNLNGYQRKLLYEHVTNRLPGQIELETRQTPRGQRILRVTPAPTGEQREKRKLLRREEQLSRVREAAGFARVIQAISASGRTVVGHNMLLDLMYIVDQFVCPLPDTCAEFKSIVTCVLPRLIDTKVMASTQPFRDFVPSTVLADLTTCLRAHPFHMPDIVDGSADSDASPYTLDGGQHHEAGYDAFITGMCFASMLNYVGSLTKPPDPFLSPSANLVQPFTNKVYVMRLADTMYLNLAGDDVTPSRGHVFHLSFPSVWKTSDIVQLFSPFSPVHVGWIDDTSAFVALDRRDQSSQVLQNLRSSTRYRLSTYTDYQAAKRMRLTRQVTSPVRHAQPVTTSPAATDGRRQGAEPVTSPLASTSQGAGPAVTPPDGPIGKKRKRHTSDENGVSSSETSTADGTACSAGGLFAVPDTW